ncbi:MAG: DUF5659 domain-containing protein [archaeon]
MKNIYLSRDFYLSAFLIASGFRMVSHSRTKGVTTFVFEDSDSLQTIVNQYFSMKALIDPILYGNSLRSLKSVIHSSDYNANGVNNDSRTVKGK